MLEQLSMRKHLGLERIQFEVSNVDKVNIFYGIILLHFLRNHIIFLRSRWRHSRSVTFEKSSQVSKEVLQFYLFITV